MDNKLDFLDGPEPAEPLAAAPEPVSEQAAPPTPEPSLDGPQRGPDGKFVAKPAETPQTPAPTPEAGLVAPAPVAAAPPAEPGIPPGYVPVSVVQALREENRRLQTPPPPAPDLNEDPEGYAAHVEGERVGLNAEWSHRYAVAIHGAESVQTAVEWAARRADEDPNFRQQSWGHPDPIGFAIEQHRREQALQMFADPKTLETFRAWQAQQGGQPAPHLAAALAAVPPPTPAAPPPSISASPGSGGVQHVPSGPGQAFGAVFSP